MIVSEQHTASIFKEEIRFFHLKETEEASFSEMLEAVYRTLRCHISGDGGYVIATEATGTHT
jgi:hypothetical protein